MLEVKNLVVKYGQISALNGISLDVEEGKLTCLLGANGAGKSTLVKTLSGLMKPFKGEILFNGENIAGLPTHEIFKRGIIQCPEGRRIFPRQTVYENLKMGAYNRKDNEIQSDIEKYYQQFPILKERRNQKAGLLSGGEQQMLAICRALMGRPKFLLLDEPSMGLAPKIVKEVFETISQIKRQGITILLIEQNAKQALRIADYGYVLDVGHITMHDSAEKLFQNETLQKAYFGG
ncbi:MAG TPA: ABC transporter ATP-binding protein [Candidatus Egerieimonas intestinavium]|uniref:ABC transporter ATP-binding protein n=1 Tax=Candidatus Egerieimonas intestinavium TaxID=2840777 RepID=A0A9D1EMG7_9FIRM|nr:ABC transporter ATP-binding protein [Candidatus Egerieimonas intestinavium]